ncbi:hypothetical protein [Nitrosomonas sp.]|uniref:hypothetical protein n=1 Tax=Nitrosomonas sp. TaxID=42353 RepID=UPI0025CE5223|nr:hypothetical protein [Nitrosomonas sp.]MBY0484598.1 hypothetical protein [Nitrosomonas sp.]
MRTQERIYFMRDMKKFKAVEQYNTFKSVLFAIIAVIVLVSVIGKMDQDLETFKQEQAYRMERNE